ncbi:MAG: hypothetical protein ACTHN5_16635 [Phycisphaerae bacterium]
MRKILVLLLSFCCVACSEYGYRFRAHPDSSFRQVYADYKVHGDTVDILVDTNGARLQTIYAVKQDTMRADPKSISYPPFSDQMMPSGGYMIHGPSFARGPTVAHFAKADLGPAPWELHLAVEGFKPMTVEVGP